MTMDKTLTKWRNKIENFNLDTIQIKNLPEPYFDLMDSETYLFLMDSDRYMDNNVINLNLKNIEQMYASLTREKNKLDMRKNKIRTIIGDTPDLDPDCTEKLKSWKYFQKPKSKQHFRELMRTLRDDAVFNKNDVDRLLEKLSGKEQQSRSLDLKTNLSDELDLLISNITIQYLNDTQIIIQKNRGNKKIPIDLVNLGFRAGGKKLTWNNFLDVLQNAPNHYWTYPRNQLVVINTRLKKWMTDNLMISFPDKFNLYYRVRGRKEKGTYKFCFQIKYNDTIQVGPSNKKAFRERFFSLCELFKSTDNEHEKEFLIKNIKELASEGKIKNFLLDKDIQETLHSKQESNWNVMSKKAFDN